MPPLKRTWWLLEGVRDPPTLTDVQKYDAQQLPGRSRTTKGFDYRVKGDYDEGSQALSGPILNSGLLK